jgi:LysM repeat protein
MARSGKTNKYVSGTVAYHRVQTGDSLYKIAHAYGTTVKTLCRLNKMTEKTKIRKGQVLRIS